MEVYGQLVSAAVENIAGDPSNTVSGRLYFNTLSSNLIFDDGTLKRTLLRNDYKIIIGTDGTQGNNVRIHHAGQGLLQFVTGSDTTAENSLSTALAQIGFRTTNFSTNPATGNTGRIIFSTAVNSLLFDNGSAFLQVSTLSGTETLTNKTLTTPVINGAVTLTGATLTNPTINGATSTNGTFTTPTITNPTISGSATTIAQATLTSARLTAPAINNPVITGSSTTIDAATITTATITAPTINGATVISGTPTISGATINTSTLASPTINTPTISTPTISGGTITKASLVGQTADIVNHTDQSTTPTAPTSSGSTQLYTKAGKLYAQSSAIGETAVGFGILTTKGDLHSFSSTDARLAVGTNNYVLTADSTQALGLKWAVAPSAPSVNTYQVFTAAGSGTYTLPTSPSTPRQIKVRMIGGGGGGGGSTTNGTNSGAGGSGANSTFGSSLLTAVGGTGGSGGSTPNGGAGGTPTLATPAVGFLIGGASGNPGFGASNTAQNTSALGGAGASTFFGGAGSAGATGAAGGSAIVNTGAGAGGASTGSTGGGTSNCYSGGGGGAGGFIEATINSPSSTYAYTVGAGGTAGAAGTGGFAGGVGGRGIIIVEEIY